MMAFHHYGVFEKVKTTTRFNGLVFFISNFEITACKCSEKRRFKLAGLH